MKPNRRYFGEGLVIAAEDSRDYGDSQTDYLIRRLIVGVAESEEDQGTGWDLVASIEVEVCEINDGIDEGYLEPQVGIYRTPFPHDSKLRKSLLRTFQQNPKFFMTDGLSPVIRHRPNDVTSQTTT